jgi:hypothetical protein
MDLLLGGEIIRSALPLLDALFPLWGFALTLAGETKRVVAGSPIRPLRAVITAAQQISNALLEANVLALVVTELPREGAWTRIREQRAVATGAFVGPLTTLESHCLALLDHNVSWLFALLNTDPLVALIASLASFCLEAVGDVGALSCAHSIITH